MNHALDELFTRLGFDRRALWRISVIFWIVFVGSCVLAVYLSAWDMRDGIIAMLYLYLILGALPILFAPAFWLIAGGLFALAGQFGREKGLSLKDAYEAVKEYGAPTVNTMGYVLLLALPIWFIAMALIDTKGIEKWFLFGLPLLPTTIYLVVKKWPDGETFNTVVRNTLLGIVLGILALGVWNTLNRQITDPAILLMQEYQAELAKGNETEKAGVIRDLIDKVKDTGVDSLDTEERKLWSRDWEKAKQTDSIKKRAETFVIEAKPTDAGWWQAHWHYVAGTVIAAIALYWFFGRGASPAGATPAGAHGSGSTEHKPSAFRGLIYLIIILGGIAWCTYSISIKDYWPGSYYYEVKTDLVLNTIEDHEVCDSRIRPGKWFVTMPAQAGLAHPRVNLEGKNDLALQFYVRYPDGNTKPMSWLKDVRINGTIVGFNDQVQVRAGGCYTVSTTGTIRDKALARVYGVECTTSDLRKCYVPTPPTLAQVVVLFSGMPYEVPLQY